MLPSYDCPGSTGRNGLGNKQMFYLEDKRPGVFYNLKGIAQ
jgi:hypothetical protein